MAKKRSWSALGERQQKRYIGAAKTGSLTGTPFEGTKKQQIAYAKKWYESGGSLEGGRGRHAPPGAAPRRVYLQEVSGRGDDVSAAALKAWRQGPTVPKWIPTNRVVMADDTAAALSQIGIHPRNWRTVDIRITPNGDAFVMTVTSKRGAVRKVVLQDRGAVAEVAALLKNREGQGRDATEMRNLFSEWENKNGEPPTIEVNIQDTEQLLNPSTPPVVPTPTKNKALPTATKKNTAKAKKTTKAAKKIAPRRRRGRATPDTLAPLAPLFDNSLLDGVNDLLGNAANLIEKATDDFLDNLGNEN